MPLDADAVVAEVVAPVRGVVFGARDSLCRARRRMSRRLQSVMRSATVAGSVAAIMGASGRHLDPWASTLTM